MGEFNRLLTGDRTRADAVVPQPLDDPTRTSSLDRVAEQAGFLRGMSRVLSDESADIHDQMIEVQLEARTDEAARRAVHELLQELAHQGFAWRDIARLVGVTVPAVRKWRQGESVSGANRRAVARLLAFVNVLQSDHLVQEPSSWMEMPLAESHVTRLDVYAAGHVRDLLAHAAGYIDTHELLDTFDPAWRGKIDDRFEIVTADDGEPVIRLHPGEQPE